MRKYTILICLFSEFEEVNKSNENSQYKNEHHVSHKHQTELIVHLKKMFAHFVILLQVIFIFHNVLSDNSAQVSKDVNQFNASGLINSGVNMAKNSPLVPVPAKGIIAAGSA